MQRIEGLGLKLDGVITNAGNLNGWIVEHTIDVIHRI